MLNVLQTLLNRMETLSVMKVETMERIVQRNGVGKDLEQLILVDTNIWDTIQMAQTIIKTLIEAEELPK